MIILIQLAECAARIGLLTYNVRQFGSLPLLKYRNISRKLFLLAHAVDKFIMVNFPMYKLVCDPHEFQSLVKFPVTFSF